MSECTSPPAPDTCTLMEPWFDRRRLLLNLCLRWTNNNHPDAEDLLSEACLRALETAHKGSEPVASPMGLWATIIANLGRDRNRRGLRRCDDPAQASDSSPEPTAWTVRPDDAAYFRQALTVTLKTLDELPELQRSALELRSTGLDYTEIAARLAVSAGNARKLVQLAREFVRRAMHEHEQRSEPRSSVVSARVPVPRAHLATGRRTQEPRARPQRTRRQAPTTPTRRTPHRPRSSERLALPRPPMQRLQTTIVAPELMATA